MSNKLTIIGRLKAKPATEAELRQALLNLVPLSRAEAGCINYNLHEAIDEPGLFLLYETWTDEAALDLHFSFAYSKEFAANASNLLATPLHMTVLREISSR